MNLSRFLPLALSFSCCLIFFDQHRSLATLDLQVIVRTKTPHGKVNIREKPGIQYPVFTTVPDGFILQVSGCGCKEDYFKDKANHWWIRVYAYSASAEVINYPYPVWIRCDYIRTIRNFSRSTIEDEIRKDKSRFFEP